MKATGIYSDVTQLIPGGQAGVDQFPGADAYQATFSNLHGSFVVMIIQFAAFLLLTFGSLLFLKHNR